MNSSSDDSESAMELENNEKAREDTELTEKAINVDTESECDFSNAQSEPDGESPKKGSDEVELI